MKARTKANWADPNTTAENETLPGWLKWVWGGRGVSYTLNFLLMAQIGSALMGGLLGMAGYISDPTVTVQPQSALDMITFMYAVMPIILGVLTLALSLLYKKERAKVLGEA